MKKLTLILLLVVISTAFLCADVYIKQNQKVGAMMGQPAKDIVSETWLGNNKMAVIAPENTMIMDMSSNKFFMVIHANKTYIETDLPLDMAKLMPAQMASMMKSMIDGMTVAVKANGQTKKVGNWNTKGYDFNIGMMGMNIKMTMWASSDVPFDWKKYTKVSGELYKAMFRMGDKFTKEFEKVDGFPVATSVNMMGANMEMTTVEISEKSPGSGVYSVPAGYKKTDKMSMGGMK